MLVASKTLDANLLASIFALEYSIFSSLSRVSFSSVVDTRLVNSSALTMRRLPVNILFAVRIIKSLTSSSTSVDAFPRSLRLLKYTVSVQSLSLISSGKLDVNTFCKRAAISLISVMAFVFPEGIIPTYFLPYIPFP